MTYRYFVFFCLCLLFWSATRAETPALLHSVRTMGQDIAKGIVQGKLRQVLVPEFADGATRTWGGEVGVAGRYVAEQLAATLTTASKKRYAIRDQAHLRAAPFTEVTSLDTLATLTSAATLRTNFPGSDGLLLGTLSRTGQSVTIHAQLLRLADMRSLGTYTSTLPLDGDLLILLGASLLVTTGPESYKVTPEMLAHAVDSAKDQPPPLLNPACPYHVEMLVGEAPKPLYRHGRELYLPARAGETYQLRVTNTTDMRTAVALFIDGLNVVRQKRVLPSSAVKVIINAKSTVVVPGWLLENNRGKAFRFVPTGESVAAQQRLVSQVGLVTAAFYPEVPETERRIWAPPKPTDGSDGERKRGLGTGEGKAIEAKSNTASFAHALRPAVILTLRYQDAAAVERYDKVKP